ncbi:hypothetical protein PCV68_000953 [Staphylococcus pseudintermedius]|nr:hypothetical protein [Staphylococcus pseudintermedius]
MRKSLIQDAKQQLSNISPDETLAIRMYKTAAIITTLMDKLDVENGTYFYVISPEDIIIDRMLDFKYADNLRYCAILTTNYFSSLDFDYIKRELKVDKEALSEFNLMVENIKNTNK